MIFNQLNADNRIGFNEETFPEGSLGILSETMMFAVIEWNVDVCKVAIFSEDSSAEIEVEMWGEDKCEMYEKIEINIISYTRVR